MMDGKTLKEIREFLGLSKRDAADLCELSSRTISLVETGEHTQKSTLRLMQLSYEEYSKRYFDALEEKVKSSKQGFDALIRR